MTEMTLLGPSGVYIIIRNENIVKMQIIQYLIVQLLKII